MSAFERILSSVRKVMLMEHQVDDLASKVGEQQKRLEDLTLRLYRLEILAEQAGAARAPRLTED